MKIFKFSALLSIILSLFILGSFIVDTPAIAEQKEESPVFLYSLHYHAHGDDRYLPGKDFREVLSRLEEDFTVIVSWEEPSEELLSGVDVMMVASPSDSAFGENPPPNHMTEQDRKVLLKYIKDGGGFILLSNQDADHNMEKDESNKLLRNFGLKVDRNEVGAKKLLIPEDTPVIGELVWGGYWMPTITVFNSTALNSLVLVQNDLDQKPVREKDEDYPGPVMAWGEYGKGKVVIVTDTGWISEWALTEKGIGGAQLKSVDNWEIMHRLARWASD